MSYCTYVQNLDKFNHHRIYHDTAYGFPIENDAELFGRLILEINQAGLSWDTILKKQDAFRSAYAGFDIVKVAAFDQQDVERLLSDAGIIRNRLKIAAAIHNAQSVVEIQKKHGSFRNWLEQHRGAPIETWVKLFKSHFKFTGGEIVREFLVSTGFLPDAHDSDCPIGIKISQLQ